MKPAPLMVSVNVVLPARTPGGESEVMTGPVTVNVTAGVCTRLNTMLVTTMGTGPGAANRSGVTLAVKTFPFAVVANEVPFQTTVGLDPKPTAVTNSSNPGLPAGTELGLRFVIKPGADAGGAAASASSTMANPPARRLRN